MCVAPSRWGGVSARHRESGSCGLALDQRGARSLERVLVHSSDRKGAGKMRNTTRLALCAGTALAAASAANAQVVNGGFESGNLTGWTVTSSLPAPVATNLDFHSGSFSALLGSDSGAEPLGDGAMYQSINVPAGGGSLSFWSKKFTTDSITFDWQ